MNKKGFSLAEMLVVMLILTVVLAAATPIITRRTAHTTSTTAGDSSRGPFYGTSGGITSNASDTIKIVDLIDGDSFDTTKLKAGTTLFVRFKYANTVDVPRLSIKGSTYDLYDKNGQAISASNPAQISASMIQFTYDGTGWIFANSTSNNDTCFISGSNTGTTTYVYPPTGYSMADLVAFIPSSRSIDFNGTVNSDDSLICNWTSDGAKITINCYDTEVRATPTVNWLAIWRKQPFADGMSINSGSNTGTTTYVYPPAGYSMADLVAFVPSSRSIDFNGTVNSDDSLICNWTSDGTKITINCYDTELRATPTVNWLAIWQKH